MSNQPRAMTATDVAAVDGTIYPPPLDEICKGRFKRRLGDVFGLTDFGVNLVRLAPGAGSAHRHWHSAEDEFVYILEGELVLVDDGGETTLSPGMIAGFPANSGNGHHLVNRSAIAATYLEVGSRKENDDVEYPDVDMRLRKANGKLDLTKKDGAPF